MAITSQAEWEERAAAFLKHKLREAEITYVELAKRLRRHGFQGGNRKPQSQTSLNGAHSQPRSFWPALPRWNWTA